VAGVGTVPVLMSKLVALAVSLSMGRSIVDAARFANAAAALSVTKAGAQPSLPTLAEVDFFLQAY